MNTSFAFPLPCLGAHYRPGYSANNRIASPPPSPHSQHQPPRSLLGFDIVSQLYGSSYGVFFLSNIILFSHESSAMR
jgi:hypothetical protein